LNASCSGLRPNAFAGAVSRRTALGLLTGGTTAVFAIRGGRIVQAQATPRPVQEEGVAPNLFLLDGEDTRINYASTSETGEPQLTYEGAYGSRSFVGDAVETEESALGRLVTVDLGPFPDQGNLWLTLLLPEFNPMDTGDDPVPFATLAILKWLVSTIAGPPREGAREEFRVVELEGTAQLVMS
jgi:hypothetical protein